MKKLYQLLAAVVVAGSAVAVSGCGSASQTASAASPQLSQEEAKRGAVQEVPDGKGGFKRVFQKAAPPRR